MSSLPTLITPVPDLEAPSPRLRSQRSSLNDADRASILPAAAIITNETANAITHGLGLALSLVAGAVLMHAAAHVDTLQWFSRSPYMLSPWSPSTRPPPPRTFSHSPAPALFPHARSRLHLLIYHRHVHANCRRLFANGPLVDVACSHVGRFHWRISQQGCLQSPRQ